MKKQVLFMSAAFVCAMAAFTSCSKIDNPSGDSGPGTGSDEVPGQTIRVLTFEDADWKALALVVMRCLVRPSVS